MTDKLRSAAQAARDWLDRYVTNWMDEDCGEPDCDECKASREILKLVRDLDEGLSGTACPQCEYHKQRAQLWRHEAYKHGGHPFDWEPELVIRREWRGLTDEEKRLFSSWLDEKPDAEVFAGIEAVLKEKNDV